MTVRVAEPSASDFLKAFPLLAVLALGGCVSPDDDISTALAPKPDEMIVLPQTVTVLPGPAEAYAAPAALQPAGAAALQAAADEPATPAEADAAMPEIMAAPRFNRAADLPLTQVALAEENDGRKPLAQSVFSLADTGDGGSGRGRLDQLIRKYAELYQVPVGLVHRVVRRESNYDARALNHGHYGLMQIKPATARGMGYEGPAQGLFDAETNLRYAVKYLRGAYLVAAGNDDRADRLYQRGYYYDAKRAGLLDETGLGHDRHRRH